MEYKIFYTPGFDKQFKKLCKKYKSLPSDLSGLIDELKANPFFGIALGNNCYKIRLAIKSKGKGKSGGARVITYVVISGKEMYLITMYDKSEQSSVSERELLQMTTQVRK